MTAPQRPRVPRRALDGVLLLDKPIGLSSNDALIRAKRLYLAKKAGHTGTLDPLASGLLPLCFGEATKFSQDLLEADKKARTAGLDLIGIFHSHPDCDAYFSKTDLENSCPWYSFVVLSVKSGKFDHAASFLPNPDQTAAEKEELTWPKS